jgi:uncharacterized membrane protein (DUF485 family)
MTHSPTTDDKPLDPAQANIVRRLRRLMLFSSVIMLAGFLVVFGVIAYRLSTTATTPAADAPIEANIGLPKGARVLSTAIADGRLTVTMDLGGRTEVRLYDLATQKQLGRVRFRTQP